MDLSTTGTKDLTMKMTNEQLQSHIDGLKDQLVTARNEFAEASFLIDVQDMIDNKVTEASIAADKKMAEVFLLEDKIRHAEGWLEQRGILRGVKASNNKTQRIGNLMRKKLNQGA